MGILSLAVALMMVQPAGTPQLKCCYRVTAIDGASGVVSAAAGTGEMIRFQLPDRSLLSRVKVEQQVYVDVTTRQVGLDARRACCAMIGGPIRPATGAVPGAAGNVPAATTPATTATAAAGPGRDTAGAGRQAVGAAVRPISNILPSISYGPPQPRTSAPVVAKTRFEARTIATTVGGRGVTSPVLHLRGLKAVEEAPGLPDGARRLLAMAVRRVPRDQSDHFVVNPRLAQEWIAAHPVPADIQPTEPSEKKCDNWYDSWDCAGQAVSDEWKRAFDHAVEEWDRATKKLAEAWETTQGCFTERTLSLPNIPVRFTIAPSMSVDLTQAASRGSGTGSVTGKVGLGVPMDADFAARLDLFYIPCLPFAVRPRALSADGRLTVGQILEGTVTASGAFKKTFTIPPTGGPVIPIQVFPIVIAGVPVSEIDVSAYLEGNIEVSADGRAEGRFQLENSNPTRFDFGCSGAGCRATARGAPAPVTTSQGAQIQGRVSVKPAIYTALQLNFNYEALSARAGPQPFLLGVATGCGAASATQSAGGSAARVTTP